VVDQPAPPATRVTVPPAGRSPLKALVRAGLDGVSQGLARVEAAAGRGAVVDIIARRNGS
jgi:hypothetical protein